MNLDRMQEFILITEEGSFLRAAQKLGVSAAVLSARFSGFEKGLGVRLLDRDAHRVRLTEEGGRFYGDCCEICSEYDRAVRRGKEAAYHEYLGLKIAVMGFEIPVLLRYFLTVYAKNHPHTHVELLDDSFCSMEEGLNDQRVDVYFGYFIEKYNRERIEKRRICDMRQYVFVPKGHYLAEREKVTLQDLGGESFLLYPETRETALRDRQRQLLEEGKVSCQLYAGSQAKTFFQQLVTMGKGIAMYPLSSLAAAPPESAALTLEAPECIAPLDMFFLRKTGNPAVQMFIQELELYQSSRDGR